MERYPDSIRNAVYALMRSGVTVEELEEQFGLGHGTVYKWLYKLRADGEDVTFVKSSDRLRAKVFARFDSGASVQAVLDDFKLCRSTVFRMRDEYELLASGAPPVPSGVPVSGAGKDEPTGVVRRQLAEPPKDALIKQLKVALAEKTMEADFFRSALREVKAQRQQSSTSGAMPSTGRSSR